MINIACRARGSQIQRGADECPKDGMVLPTTHRSAAGSASGNYGLPRNPLSTAATFWRVARLMVLGVAISLVAGCSKKIDGSSMESFADSLQKISKDLPADQRKDFDDDLKSIGNLKNLTLGQLRTELNGKTVADAHALAEQLRAEAARQREQQDRALLADLQQRKARAEVESKMVAAVLAQVTAISLEPKQWGDTQEITFEIQIKNGSTESIATLRYMAELQWSGGTIPREMYIDLQPPLAPGESRQMTVKKVNFGGTSGSSDLRNAAIQVKSIGFTTPGHSNLSLNGPANFGPLERGELDRLLKQYGDRAPNNSMATKNSSASSATCTDKWVAAHRKQVGEDAAISQEQLGEWEVWCKEGKLPS
jgi:hypothetical protein